MEACWHLCQYREIGRARRVNGISASDRGTRALLASVLVIGAHRGFIGASDRGTRSLLAVAPVLVIGAQGLYLC